MTSPDYIQKINELRKKVGLYSNFSFDKKDDTNLSLKIPYINKLSLFYLLSPVLVIILILLYIKPSFITKDTMNRQKIVYSKLFIVSLISGVIINICIWYYKKSNV